ncbi:otoferlin-like, partial [Hyposmocoma kahamanoa]|uniref:otoferlin-like n=1 Tax=Hyposmocoma kahamanoa TaxID=1477025 RepID=UPI000E6D73AF
MRTTRQRSRHLKSRSFYRLENEYNPETLQQYFQVSVNVLEARKLAWSNSHSKSSYVIIMLGKKKHRSTIKKNMEEPCYREYFVFELYLSIREIRRLSLWLAVMEPRCYAPPKLIGETNIDLGAIWMQPHHQVYHKWVQLNLNRNPPVGPVGFLKVDISINFRGEVMVMPATITGEKIEENILLPTGSEQQRANYVVTIYAAYRLCSGMGVHDRKPSKPPNTYIRISFCGLVAKTGVQDRNYNPIYCEQISLVEMFPNTHQVIRFEVCAVDGTFCGTIAAADLQLSLLSHDGDN